METDNLSARSALVSSSRVVVKVGTRLLASKRGSPEARRLRELVQAIVLLKKSGKEVVLVTSGAVGMGIDALGLKRRPTTVPDLQMAAAVGQARLMAYYEKLFLARKLRVGQILLTREDTQDRLRHLNARNAILNLLRHDVVPIVNENDAVSVSEIQFGDNDMLAALTTLLVNADVLVLLSTVNGLRESVRKGKTRRVSYIERVDQSARAMVRDTASDMSLGGMGSKLEAADFVAQVGKSVVIADGRKSDTLARIFAGEDVGTLIGNSSKLTGVRGGRKRWLAFFHRSEGVVVVDQGASLALSKNGRSLLAIGIKAVRGNFSEGALVTVEDASGRSIARGLVDYSSSDITKIRGKRSSEIASVLGRKDYDEVIHRDNMVVLEGAK